MTDRLPDRRDAPTGAPSASASILKLGGSLLTVPDLHDRVLQLLKSQPIPNPVIVVGGGFAANCVRRWQIVWPIDDDSAHRLAIRAMSYNALRLCRLWPRTQIVRTQHDVQLAWQNELLPLLDVNAFLNTEERRLTRTDTRDTTSAAAPTVLPLPASWDVTSDAIAAWVAQRWPAGTLWLLKSCPDTGTTVADWCRAGLVDAFLPKLINDNLQLRWVNLR